MSNGSLASFVFGPSKPNWLQRVQIALGTAMGLFYLHEKCNAQIIHCDIKPQNILLDESFIVGPIWMSLLAHSICIFISKWTQICLAQTHFELHFEIDPEMRAFQTLFWATFGHGLSSSLIRAHTLFDHLGERCRFSSLCI